MDLCAAILAGGLGTRLRSVVSDRPKVLAQVAGQPFLAHLLDQLYEAGVTRAVLCTGYMAGMISDEFGDRYRGISLTYSVETSPLGTGGALANAAPLLSGDMLLVLNGDSYCHCPIEEFAMRQKQSKAPAGMALARVEDVGRYGAVITGSDFLVKSFTEKGGDGGPGWINAGIYLLPRTVLDVIPRGHSVSLEREIFPRIVAQGLYGYRCTGPFIDIGIPEDLVRSQTLLGDRMKGEL
ncbi:nucleotidyltransferase family protein [Geomonas edaphica]|uniref:nucleotidyltransferase family protein n=1 Tax=Geomonas edaphica TaxID=2570226 RepID=UPI0010A8FCF8|nr:nucleotidyltransferase family protein [Geomonas edaphica]